MTNCTTSIKGLAVCLMSSCLAMAGCGSRDYLVEQPAYVAARQATRTEEPSRVALPALPADARPGTQPVYLRAAGLRLLPVPEEEGRPAPALRVRAPDPVALKTAGGWLLGVGLAHLAGLAGVLAYDLYPFPCPYGEVCDRVPMSLFVGPPLGVIAMGMIIPGIVLTVKGARTAGEVPAGRPGIHYVLQPMAAAAY